MYAGVGCISPILRVVARLVPILAAVAVLVALTSGQAQAAGFAAAVPRGAALDRLAAGGHPALVAIRDDPRAARLVRFAGGRLLVRDLNIWKIGAPAARSLVPALDRLGALRYAKADRPLPELAYFTDPLTTPDIGWHLYAIGADQLQSPGPGFPLTIIDTGIDLTHPDFAGRPDVTLLDQQVVRGFGADEYHGTMVASTAAGARNGIGGEGVYPGAALRVYDLPTLSSGSVAAAIDAAAAAGPSVINLSLGGPGPSRAVYEAVIKAEGSGSLVVAASGNELTRGNPLYYPASFPHVLTVGAIGRDGLPARFSSSSRAVDLVAPGEEIPIQNPGSADLYDAVSGTSFATPIVSAAAAWIKTVRPDLTLAQVADVLRLTAKDIDAPGFDDRTGFGLLNLPAGLAAPAPALDPLEPNDDVLQVIPEGLFTTGKRPMTGPKGGNVTVTAALDGAEDPNDVYRIVVPGRRKITVVVTPSAHVRTELWTGNALTVLSGSTGRLGAADKPGASVERIAFVNKKQKAVTVFLRVSSDERRVGYSAAVTTARAQR
jgi:subtilisin family serine protease